MKTVLLTGSQGFIGTYVCKELLDNGYKVIGMDNYSKYGKLVRPHDNHDNFNLIEWDCIGINDLDIPCKIDIIINIAAMIGGISYFHKYAYDLLATNERISASVFDFAIERFKRGELERIISISSSMVYENTLVYPTPEDQLCKCPPPFSTYGFQKLATEYFCKGAWEQYKLPYTIIRPFNCVGVGEEESNMDEKITIGNVEMMMSHVLPDLINRSIKNGPDKALNILGNGEQIRHYTNGRDISKAIRLIIEDERTINQDYNVSCDRATTVKELASIVWKELYGNKSLKFINEKPFIYDVQKRSPSTEKLKALGIECNIPLEKSVKEVIDYMRNKNDK